MATKSGVRRTAQRVNGADGIDSTTMLRVLAAVQRGDFSARMPAGSSSSARKVAAALNAVIESNQGLEREIRRFSRSIGKEGQVKHAALVRFDDGVERRSEEHTSELQSLTNLVCRLLLEKK